MVNGRLRCLGSSQHLKLRFGDGFEVNVKTSIPALTDLVKMVQESTCRRQQSTGGTAITATTTLELESIVKADPESVTLKQLEDTRIMLNQLPSVLFSLGINSSIAVPNHEMQDLLNLFAAEGGSMSLLLLLEWVWAEKSAKTLHRFMNYLSRGEGADANNSPSRSFGEEKGDDSESTKIKAVPPPPAHSSSVPHDGFANLLERSSAHNFRYRLKVNLTAPSGVGASRVASLDDPFAASSASGPTPPPSALAYIFRKFEANKGLLHVQEYSVGQTTLEQIFNQFAASQDNPEVAAAQSAPSRLSITNRISTDRTSLTSPLGHASAPVDEDFTPFN